MNIEVLKAALSRAEMKMAAANELLGEVQTGHKGERLPGRPKAPVQMAWTPIDWFARRAALLGTPEIHTAGAGA